MDIIQTEGKEMMDLNDILDEVDQQMYRNFHPTATLCIILKCAWAILQEGPHDRSPHVY